MQLEHRSSPGTDALFIYLFIYLKKIINSFTCSWSIAPHEAHILFSYFSSIFVFRTALHAAGASPLTRHTFSKVSPEMAYR
jgi:hypothetical protein